MGKELAELMQLLNSENKEKFVAKVGFTHETERYILGKPERPIFAHDNGFLDVYPPRKPTISDTKMPRKWERFLDESSILCEKNSFLGFEWTVAKYIRECGGEQPEANKAYRHFLFGDGKPRTVDYEKYIEQEEHGRAVVTTIAKDFIGHVERIGKNRSGFSVTSKKMYAVGGQHEVIKGPKTTNWDRTIGAHQIWVSANIAVEVVAAKIVYAADVTFHMEDQYNFNPGQRDKRTHLKDEQNGMLELSGYGKQYMTYATFYRKLTWTSGDVQSAIITGPGGPVALNAKFQ